MGGHKILLCCIDIIFNIVGKERNVCKVNRKIAAARAGTVATHTQKEKEKLFHFSIIFHSISNFTRIL